MTTKVRYNLSLLIVVLAVSPVGCGLFAPSHHDTLDYKPIHAAAEGGDLATVKALVKENPSLVNIKDWDDLTPLHLAVLHGHKDVAEFLLINGALVNAKTNKGVTPMHLAAQTGNQALIGLLLVYHADINAIDSEGWTPLVRAKKWDHPEVVGFLIEHGAKE